MALVQYGSLVTGIKGRLGGHVFQSNRKGDFIRNWARPRQQFNDRSQLLRNNMSMVAALWCSLTLERKSAWAAECSSYTFYNRYGAAFTPNAYQLFVYAQLQFASLGLSIVDTIPIGGTVANIVSGVSDYDFSANTCDITLSSAPSGPYYTIVRVSKLSRSGNELASLPYRYLTFLHGSSSGSFSLVCPLLDMFGSNLAVGWSFKIDVETIRYSGFAPGAHYQKIINIID